MKKVHSLIVVSCLSVAGLHAQTVSDNFNDNTLDPVIWEAPVPDTGNGQLTEVGGRLEFSADALPENYVFQQLRQYPSYDQAWQVQAVVSMSTNDFSAGAGLGAVAIDIGTTAPGDKYVSVGYGAGYLPGGGPLGVAVLSGGGNGTNAGHENITPLTLPPAIGVLVVYDPHLRLIRVYYDPDTDPTDGEWTLYESYTIDGSTVAGAVSFDWGMTTSDTFGIVIEGYSEGPAITAGSAWADDFEFIPGPMRVGPTFAEDFNDNSRDTNSWQAPDRYDGTSGDLVEQGERLEFTASAEAENGVGQALNHSPSYDEAWQVQVRLSVDTNLFSAAGETGSMAVQIGNSTPSDHYIAFGYGAGILTNGVPPLTVLFEEATGIAHPTVEGNIHPLPLPPVIAVRATYDPNLRIVRMYHRGVPSQPGDAWTMLKAYTIDGSTVAGAETRDWGMIDTDVFHLGLGGNSEVVAIPAGGVWADDFELNQGSTVQSSVGLSFFDDFHDDSRDPDWNDPVVDAGTPELIEVNDRLEFVVASASGEHGIDQSVDWVFWPQYDQAFEVNVEAHCLPAAVTIQDQVGGMDLVIANDSGPGSMALSVAALFDGGFREQILAADNSEVEPTNDWPENIEFGALPEVVGLRMVWEPDTRTLSCYFDTDGDRTVQTWVLFADYTLDGSTNGTTHIADWQMSATNRFRISINGFSESTMIDPGEAYFDNFSLVNAPLLTGYTLWASAIPDPGMRAATDDASANGIPNLLQYMYGLAPMATDTDVQLSIQMDNGVPVLIHGLNESAPDYMFGYQFKSSLSDGWTWATGSEPTLIETNLLGGKTVREITLPLDPSNTFFRLEVVPQ